MPENRVIYIGATSIDLNERLHYHVQSRCPVGKFLKKSGYTRNDLKIEAIEYIQGKAKTFQREHDVTLEYMKESVLLNDCLGSRLSEERKRKIGEETSNRPFRKWLDVEIRAKEFCKEGRIYVYLLLRNSKPYFIGRAMRMYDALVYDKKKFNCDMKELDFEILATCNSVKEADTLKEKFILNYHDKGIKNIQIGNHLSREYVMSGTEAAKLVCSGVKNYKAIIVVDMNEGKLLCSKDVDRKVMKKCIDGIQFEKNNGFALAIDVSLSKMKEVLSEEDFVFIAEYVKNKNKHLPAERVKKLIERDKDKHVECIELRLIFKNLEEAAHYVRTSKRTIWNALNDITEYAKILEEGHKKLHWRYTDEEANFEFSEPIAEDLFFKKRK